MKISDFDFKLPNELIALYPAKPRDSSKLLRVNSSDSFEDTTFSQLTNFLNEGDVLVVNDTKVIPSKIIGFKVNAEKELTRISFTFFENKENGQWKALAKPAKKINKNDLIFFKNDDDRFYDLFAQIIDKNKAFTACKNEVKSEYFGANRYRLARIRSSQGVYKIHFVVSSSAGKQKVLCELDKYSGARVLTAL